MARFHFETCQPRLNGGCSCETGGWVVPTTTSLPALPPDGRAFTTEERPPKIGRTNTVDWLNTRIDGLEIDLALTESRRAGAEQSLDEANAKIAVLEAEVATLTAERDDLLRMVDEFLSHDEPNETFADRLNDLVRRARGGT